MFSRMTRFRFIILLGALLFIFTAAGWLWWNRRQPVDMTNYAPADALIYVEANDLPQIAIALTSTAAWRALAEPAKLDFNPQQFSWMATLAGRTGFAPAEAVVLARSQIAVVVLGVEATETPEVTIKPRLAVIVETHTGEERVRHAVDKLVGDFARRAYGAPQVTHRDAEAVHWTTWALPAERRQIVAATFGSIAVIGNDEEAVEACLAVKRGERPSLRGDRDLEEMRRRTDAGDSLAFAYISQVNAAKLLEIGATIYAAQLTLSPQVQSTAATLLPQILPRLIGAIGWSAHSGDERIEDRYFFQVQDQVAARLQTPLSPADDLDFRLAGMLPAETYQTSAYLYRDPEAAWRGAQAALSSQLDFGLAPLLVLFADKSLEPYGIAEPRGFFRLAAPPIATARLDEESNVTVMIARVRDANAMMRLLRQRFGSRTERVGNYTMLIRSDTEAAEAASIVDDYLLMGERDGVRRCLSAHTTGQTLLTTDSFKSALNMLGNTPLAEQASVATYTKEQGVVRASVRTFAALRGSAKGGSELSGAGHDATAFAHSLDEYAYAVSETRLVSGGFEKRTQSVFGLFGNLIAQLGEDSSTPRDTLSTEQRR